MILIDLALLLLFGYLVVCFLSWRRCKPLTHEIIRLKRENMTLAEEIAELKAEEESYGK